MKLQKEEAYKNYQIQTSSINGRTEKQLPYSRLDTVIFQRKLSEKFGFIASYALTCIKVDYSFVIHTTLEK